MRKFISQSFTLLLSLSISSTLLAQINYGGHPSFVFMEGEITETQVQLPSIDREVLDAEDAVTDQYKEAAWRFGVEFPVEYSTTNSGYWIQEGDENVWRLAVTCDHSVSVSLNFSEFNLEKGQYVFIWSPESGEFLGKFDHRNNKEWGSLATGLLYGSRVVVELHQPTSYSLDANLEIGTVVHGYRSLLLHAEDVANELRGPFGNSGDCNINVNCPEGDDWQTESRSVALIVEGGFAACSGALINNTLNDGTPYFLTANHCLGTPGNWVFYFNHESATCNGSTGPTNQSVSGSTLLVSNAGSDFALLELSETPPASFNVQYAGWDASGNSPLIGVGIHHPSGDVKKICFEEDSPYESNQAGAAVWYIDQWELGVTEGGSSGSPLFDQNHRIIGQLYGGWAACSGSVNNGQFDYYGRLDVSWGFGADEYLDPTGSGITSIDGYPDGSALYANDASVSVPDAPEGTLCNNDPISLQVTITNTGTDNLTSAVITYNFNGTSAQQINWSGNLSQYETDVITLPSFTPVGGANTVTITVSNPNGSADENSFNNQAVVEFSTLTGDSYAFTLALTLDDYGSETTWEVLDGNTVISSGGPYQDDQDGMLIEEDMCLANGCYTITIFDSYEDGICCEYGEGNWALYDGQGDVIYASETEGAFGASESDYFCTDETSVQQIELSNLNIYPNPASNTVRIALPVSNGTIAISDASGRIVESTVVTDSYFTTLDVSSFSEGMYFVQFTDRTGAQIVRQLGIAH